MKNTVLPPIPGACLKRLNKHIHSKKNCKIHFDTLKPKMTPVNLKLLKPESRILVSNRDPLKLDTLQMCSQ